MKRKIILAMFAFLFLMPVGIVSAEEVKEEVGQAIPTSQKGTDKSQKEDIDHEEIKEEKGHKHEEGMHGMMGHHSIGWIIVMGIIMVVMMAAHIL